MLKKAVFVCLALTLTACTSTLPQNGEVAEVQFSDLFDDRGDGFFTAKYPTKIRGFGDTLIGGMDTSNPSFNLNNSATLKVKNVDGVMVILAEKLPVITDSTQRTTAKNSAD